MSQLAVVGLPIMGLILVVLFYLDVVPSIEQGALIFLVLMLWGMTSIRISRLSLLPRLIIVLYSMPFIPLIWYLFDKNYIWMSETTNLTILQYTQDRLLLSYVIVVGIIGFVGLLTGIRLEATFHSRKQRLETDLVPAHITHRGTLDGVAFYLLLGLVLLLTWMNMPRETIITAPYASSEPGIAYRIGLNSASVLANLLLVLLYVDAERDQMAGRKRRWKFRALFATLFIAIFMVLLAGNRHSIGAIVALMGLYVTGSEVSRVTFRRRSVEWRRVQRLVLPGALVFVVFTCFGILRYSLSKYGVSAFSDPVGIFVKGLATGTWSSVLMTNVGMAARYLSGPMEYYYGRTYLDYVLSFPPRILTKALGIERPIEATKGPAWWFQALSQGGVHVAVVPFMNFGALGTFVILGIYGFLVARWEVKNTSTMLWRLVYGTVLTSAHIWFWYGDMNLIRGLMAAIVFWYGYRVMLSLQKLLIH